MVLCQGPFEEKNVKVKSFLLALALCVMPVSIRAQEVPVPTPIEQKLQAATLAVYQGKQVCKWNAVPGFFEPDYEWGCEFKTRFMCTATVVERLSEIDYVGLTAGHCFDWNRTNEYYVAQEIADKPVVHKIFLWKFENDDRYDYAIFKFQSAEALPVIDIDLSSTPKIGTRVVNVNFALGLIKQTTEGKVVSGLISQPIPRMHGTEGRFLASVGIGPGASGSALVNPETGKIVGIVEAVFPATQMPTVAMPMGQTFKNFTEDDSAGLKPQAPRGMPPQPPAPPVREQHSVADLHFLMIYGMALGAIFGIVLVAAIVQYRNRIKSAVVGLVSKLRSLKDKFRRKK